ncbi:MarR family transcriptional regulator [Apilactobacillus timberlakei]|uniref:MarR family winged helix-turn-helix transcriptional regulator n=1 Tax=Apilactobacillus timberlakei TaxID=2008380 RepID=UPI00112C6B55|nr:MarR family transcriptional regulator [Apilactobacillus timberlakei]TPR18764.1 MarR family transcriptional regulator [Apilactobacillus timberlakei]TPR21071.1 MarR family transcriptional regulator [Apilactobacillus timberlakei]TPR23722.1 MarR family transcriptional regulator [Apilactobacillus timberlakei]TPR25072.1 MarR family transcriptional regulator [Apilactobacillus timberlakei]
MNENVGRLVKIASIQFERHFDKMAREYGLTSTQMSIIDFLMRNNNEIFQKDIEREFYIQRSTASVLLKRMEDKCLIKRISSTLDARKKQVILTEKSVKLHSKINNFINENQRLMNDNFSDNDLKDLTKGLKKLIYIMEDKKYE